MSDFFEFREKFITSGQKKSPDAAKSNALSVSQLTRMIDTAIQKGVPPRVLVQGELSNVSRYRSSGHLYFTLKDADCCIDCVMWKSEVERLKFDVEDGVQVLISGDVRVYGAKGRYQLYAKTIEPMGKGALEQAYRKLYAKLEAEGLFAADRKRVLPRYPMLIALITSRDGAAVQDMLKILRRYPWIKLKVLHVAVQGPGSAEQIVAAIRSVKQGAADLVLLGRGGGSLEDLWSFNEEIVARAIVSCSVPVVSGIGHEVDVSIADLVADYHAHTPTEAAQVVTANWRNAREILASHGQRLRREMRMTVNHIRQRLDDRQRNLSAALRENLHRSERVIESRDARLRRFHPRFQLKLIGEKLGSINARFRATMQAQLHRRAMRLKSIDEHLQAISPQSVLKRGYSITTLKKGGRVLRSIADAKTGETIVTRVSDGQVESTVDDARQPKLFG